MDPEDLMGDDWTPSMNDKLNRLNAAVGSIGDDLDKGNLSPEDHGTLMGQIEPQRQALMGAKQAAFQKSIQQQKHMAMDQHAFQTALDTQSKAGRAAAFHDSLVHIADPFNPEKTKTGFINEKGNFEAIDFPEKEEGDKETAPSQYGNDAKLDYFPATGGMEVGENGASPQHTMNINIGGQQSRATFDQGAGGWQQTGQQRFNSQTGRWEDMPVGSAMGGTPTTPQAQGMHGELNNAEIMAIGAQAQTAARSLGLRPGTREFNDFAKATAGHLLTSLQSRKAQDLEHRRQEGARATHEAATAQQKAADAEEKKTDKLKTDYSHHVTEAHKEIETERKELDKAKAASDKAKAKANQPGATQPEKDADKEAFHDYVSKGKDYLMSPEAMEEEANNRAQMRLRNRFGWTDEHFGKIGANIRKGGAAAKGESRQVSAPAETSVKTPAQIQAEAFNKHIEGTTKSPGEGAPDKNRKKGYTGPEPLSRFGISKFD